MVKASLRSTATDAGAQKQVAAAAAPAAAVAAQPQAARAPAAAAVTRPAATAIINPRGGAPARPAAAPAAPAIIRRPRAAVAPPAAAPAQPARATVTRPAAPQGAAAALSPRTKPAVVIETIPTKTPVEGVEVESINTSVESELLGAPVEGPAATQPVIDVDPTPAAEVQAEPQEAQVVDEGPTDPDDAVPQPPTQQRGIIVRPPSSLAPRASFSDSEGLQGDWGPEDQKFPRLTIVRGSGQLSQQWNEGTLLYADSELLPAPNLQPNAVNPLLCFVPLVIHKGWRESLTEEQQQAGELPRNAATVDEVESLGGTTQWVGGQKPSWGPSAKCILLLEQPADTEGNIIEHPSFVQPLDGRNYAVALYYVANADFKCFADVIYNTARTSLQVPITDAAGNPIPDAKGRIQKKVMLYKNFWTVQYTKVKRGNYMVWAPQARLLAKEETGPEVRQYIESILGLSNEAAAAEAE